MRRSTLWVLAATLGVVAPARAQNLARSITAADGLVQVIYPSRPNACGDGQSFIGNILDTNQRYVDDAGYSNTGRWNARPCVRGPARVLATVISGEVTRIRAYVGPVPTPTADVRTVNATAADAASWLAELLSHSPSRVAGQAVLPLIVADGPEPWPLLIKVARDVTRPREVVRSAMLWLSNGVSHHLGLDDSRALDSDDDEMRRQAVFVISQRKKSESMPELIDLARNGKYPSVRRDALFWLSQSGDSRAVEVYADLLGIK